MQFIVFKEGKVIKHPKTGEAIGDILLEEGQTVETVIYEELKNSLYALGYTVVDSKAEVTQDTFIMDVFIDKFWAWMYPGFSALTFKAEINTTIDVFIPEQNGKKVIYASAINKGQVGSEANWKKVYRMVLEGYATKAKEEFKNLNIR